MPASVATSEDTVQPAPVVESVPNTGSTVRKSVEHSHKTGTSEPRHKAHTGTSQR